MKYRDFKKEFNELGDNYKWHNTFAIRILIKKRKSSLQKKWLEKIIVRNLLNLMAAIKLQILENQWIQAQET